MTFQLSKTNSSHGHFSFLFSRFSLHQWHLSITLQAYRDDKLKYLVCSSKTCYELLAMFFWHQNGVRRCLAGASFTPGVFVPAYAGLSRSRDRLNAVFGVKRMPPANKENGDPRHHNSQYSNDSVCNRGF